MPPDNRRQKSDKPGVVLGLNSDGMHGKCPAKSQGHILVGMLSESLLALKKRQLLSRLESSTAKKEVCEHSKDNSQLDDELAAFQVVGWQFLCTCSVFHFFELKKGEQSVTISAG